MNEIIDYCIEHGVKAIVFWVVGALVVFALFGVFNLNVNGDFPSIDSDKWQAVFLENGQVYFGRLREYDQNFVELTDVYYLKTAADLDTGANLNLIKLGGEVHGPEDEMFIAKDSILYFENMKETSRVVESIERAQ
ncbi:MAG: hypothetical protein WA021_03680 [Minisyncoccia bacterium]